MRSPSFRPRLLLAVLLAAAGCAMMVEVVRTSTTFDEIVLVSAGARALETGDWSMVVDQPPLMPVLYGLPVWASRPVFPEEGDGELGYDERWEYARDLFFRLGNDPGRLALLSRTVAVALALALVVLAYAYGSWIAGPWAGLTAAALTTFLPDFLAHGAIAYNDLALALAYLAALWAIDAAVREPGVARGSLVGGLLALALGVKFSAVALGPALLVIVGLEAHGRRLDRRWWRRLGLAAAAALVVGYLVTVLLYRGDVWLIWLEQGFRYTVQHASAGHPAPAFLFGRTSPDGWWYFFPLSFFLKTPVALHGLLVVASLGFLLRRSGDGPGGQEAWSSSRLRGLTVGAVVFLGFLLRASLNVGTRYALPAWIPLLMILAVGVERFWRSAGRRGRAVVATLVVLYAGSTLTAFPFFLAYESEWVRARGPGREAMVDSNVDWGQGLLALRDFQEREGTGVVSLSYFGSALPEAYGVQYEALRSFLSLGPTPMAAVGGSPTFTVISITNLHGLYFDGEDPFARYRGREPYRVLGGSLYVFREGGT